MIQAYPQPLSPHQQEQLIHLLDKSEAKHLRQVVECRAVELEVEALNEVAQSATFVNFGISALEKLKQAQKYRHFLEVFDEIAKQDPNTALNHTITLKI